MEKNVKRYLVVLIVFLITAALVFIDGRLSKNVPPVMLADFPLNIAEWRGIDHPVEERIQRILQTEHILSRHYRDREGDTVLLSLVYYPDNKIGFHNPESCNVGAGSHIVQKDVYSFPLHGSSSKTPFSVNRLILDGSSGNKAIFYFFVSGDYITENYVQFRIHMMKQQMCFTRPSGAQIQIHRPISSDLESTMATMQGFTDDIIPYLLEYLR